MILEVYAIRESDPEYQASLDTPTESGYPVWDYEMGLDDEYQVTVHTGYLGESNYVVKTRRNPWAYPDGSNWFTEGGYSSLDDAIAHARRLVAEVPQIEYED